MSDDDVGDLGLGSFIASVNNISENQDTDILFYASDIDPHGASQVRKIVDKRREEGTARKNIFLVIGTLGGLADSAYHISRCLQEAYCDGKFVVAVPYLCKSAGTLIAVGANEIVMSNGAEFGPLDVQLLHQDVEERTSGLTSTNALATLRNEVAHSFEDLFLKIRRKTRIKTELASKVASEIVSTLYSSIFSQFDPMSIGENERAMAIATQYGERLREGRNLMTSNGLQKLVESYPSHGFVIDRSESATIFDNIRSPGPDELILFETLLPSMKRVINADDNIAFIEYIDPVYNTKKSDENLDSPEVPSKTKPREGDKNEQKKQKPKNESRTKKASRKKNVN